MHAAANIALAAQEDMMASPEVRGKDKTPELGQPEAAFRAPRGRTPAKQRSCFGRSRDGSTSRALSAPVEARKSGVEFVNAP